MAACLIGFGSNLGDRKLALTRSIELLSQNPEINFIGSSQAYTTTPIGGPAGQDEFINAAIFIETKLNPLQLLALLQQVENKLGRERGELWGARTVDLDLLLYGDVKVNTPELTIPHPRMAFRRFVLESAAEVAPDMIHPLIGWTVQQLLDHLNSAENYLAITGIPACRKTELAQFAAKQTSTGLILDPPHTEAIHCWQPETAGLDRPTEIEFLRQRTVLLEQREGLLEKEEGQKIGAFNDTDQSEKIKPILSDFWLGQSLAYARAFLSEEDATRCEQAWEESHTITPKLIVFLDPPVADTLLRFEGGVKPEIIQRIERLSDELRRLVFQPQRGPVLHLSKETLSNAKQETVAALIAMQ